MSSALPRWTISGRTIVLQNGTRFKLPRRTPKSILRELARLPYDYIEIGGAAADLKFATNAERRYHEATADELKALQKQWKTLKEQDINSLDRINVILQDDLEKALNLLIRINLALGAQPGGDFFKEIEDLVTKYKMKMYYAKDYKPEGIATALSSPTARIEVDDDRKVNLRDELPPGTTLDDTHDLPPGQYIIPATDDDPFDYHLTITKNNENDDKDA